MSIRAIVQLHYPKMNPSNGDGFYMIGGKFDDSDDENIKINTEFGLLVIPKEALADSLFVKDEIVINQDDLPFVWFLNNIND